MQRIHVVNGVVKSATHADLGQPNSFWWSGPPLDIGDPDPRPEGLRNEKFDLMNNGLALMGSTEPFPYAIQKWLELFGDWINELNFATTGQYRSQQELVGEWIARLNGTYTPGTPVNPLPPVL